MNSGADDMKSSDDKNNQGNSSDKSIAATASKTSAQGMSHEQMLSSGQPIVFSGGEPEDDREILAGWVVDALRAGLKVYLANALIVGQFDARDIVAERELALIGCTIRDAIADFSHSIFKQRADFSGTHFTKGAVFARCRFDSDLMLDGCHISGVGILLMDAEIKRALMSYHLNCDPGTQANFQRCHIHSIAKFPGSVFYGEADFNGCRFDGQATFSGVTFVGEAIFGGCTFGETALFCGGTEQDYPGAIFSSDTTFISARFVSQAAFQGAVFKKSISFNLAKFEGFAYFNNVPNRHVPPTAFERKVDFAMAHFSGQANFQGVTFGDYVSFNSAVIKGAANFGIQLKATARCTFVGPADFVNMNCESVSDFRGSVFHQKADFRNAKFGASAEFTGETSSSLPPTIFHGPALFANAVFEGVADFRQVGFEGRASFAAARMEQNVLFCGLGSPTDDGASFAEEAQFSLTRIEGTANFRKVTFLKDASFTGASVNGPALFEGAVFRARAIFSLCRLRDVANFSRSEFLGDLNLQEARITVLLFSAPVGSSDHPVQFKSKVDLRGCTYDRIEVDQRKLLCHIDPYARQPFVQLEKTARNAGDDTDADAIYLFRCCTERRRQWERREVGSWLFSSVHQLAANYGVKPYRLIVVPLVLLTLGIFIFARPQAVRQADPNLVTEAKVADPGHANLERDEFSSWGLATRLSLRIFLPVEVPLASNWEPSNRKIIGPLRASDFATLLKIAGWILVPLGVAALTGLLRTKPSASSVGGGD
jgi:uncharacterized protein YjbI with pentapeptide repeats